MTRDHLHRLLLATLDRLALACRGEEAELLRALREVLSEPDEEFLATLRARVCLWREVTGRAR